MKSFLLGILCVVVGSGCSPGTAQERPASPTAAPTPALSTNPPTPPAPVAATVPTPSAPSATNPPAPAALPKPPPELPPPAQEVVRLTQSALGPSVITNYIESIQTPFSLTADQLIYLSDLGIGDPVINALLRKSSAPAPAPAPLPPPAVATTTNPIPVTTPPTVPTTNPPLALQGIPGGPPPPASAPVYGPAQPVAPAPAPAPAAPVVVAQPQAPVGYATFYESLSPYGNWVQIEPYGWCWQPSVVVVNNGWRPYCDGGQWVWTDYGWYWQSTYSWGWAPFHYGRWHRSARIGWVWCPGSDWGPAWVSWRQSDLYCGWAPLPPECRWSAGVGFSWYSGGTAVSIGFGLSTDYWYACSWNRFRDPGLHRWGIERHHVNQFVGNSRMAVGGDRSINIVGNNNTVIVNDGIPRDQVQRHTREEIRKHSVVDAAAPGISPRAATGSAAARPEIAAYRPQISAQPGSAPAPSPAILGRQETRKSPGGVSASGFTPSGGATPVPTRPTALNPVPPVLGAAAPAASRPGIPTTPPGASTGITPTPVRPAPSVRPAPFAGPSNPVRPPIGSTTPNTAITPSRPEPSVPPSVTPRPPVTAPAPRPTAPNANRIESVSPRAGATPTVRPGTFAPGSGNTAYPGNNFGQSQPAPTPTERPRFETPVQRVPTAPSPTIPSARPDFPGRSMPMTPPAHFSPPAHNPTYISPAPRPMPSYSSPSPAPSLPPGRNFTPSAPAAPITPHPGSGHAAPARSRSPDR